MKHIDPRNLIYFNNYLISKSVEATVINVVLILLLLLFLVLRYPTVAEPFVSFYQDTFVG